MSRVLMAAIAAILLPASISAQQAKNLDAWASWQFLVGEWVGEGGGEPGRGTGAFSFHLDLQGKVLVRRNRADYPPTKDRPAYSHEDLMVIYMEPGGQAARAIYFDNEGHVIHYTAAFSEDDRSLTFLSDPLPAAPRFRLTYTKKDKDGLGIKFEIAPPGKPDAFSIYLQADARRKDSR